MTDCDFQPIYTHDTIADYHDNPTHGPTYSYTRPHDMAAVIDISLISMQQSHSGMCTGPVWEEINYTEVFALVWEQIEQQPIVADTLRFSCVKGNWQSLRKE